MALLPALVQLWTASWTMSLLSLRVTVGEVGELLINSVTGRQMAGR